MKIEFHAAIFDEDFARAENRRAEIGFSFSGMTEVQRALMIYILRRTADKLEEHAPDDEEAMSNVFAEDRLRKDP